MSGFKYNTFAWMNMVHALSKLPVAIIIVNWNKKDLLHICLTSLKTVTSYPNYNVIVVDNGSSDGSANFVQENFSWTDLIALDKNFGFSIANNKGIAYALKKYNPAYFLLLNNDTKIIQADWIDKMVHLAESDSNTGIVGSKLVYPDGRTQYLGTQITASGFSWLTSSQEKLLPPIFEVDAVLGACFLIKRRLFDKIGYLDVGFSPYIHEESDYCMRARCAGWHVKMDLDVSVVHLWKSSMKKVQPEYV
jgi:GT2 family glycosyltransferase